MIEEVVSSSLKEGGRYLVAVSGGADSICLLHAVCRLAEKKDLGIHAAHVDHGLRESAARDAEFVQHQCRTLGVPVHIHKAESAPEKNIESWGRTERYRFFKAILAEHKLDAVLTAHTANDVVETFLMRVVANKEPRNITAREDERSLIRPLLTVWRQDIDTYLTAHGVSHCEDESNRDSRYLRNRVRNKLIPFLGENFDGDLLRVIYERACAADSDSKLLDSLTLTAQEELSKFDLGSRDWLRTLKTNIEALDINLSWRLIDAVLRPVVGFGVGRQWGARLREFFLGNAARIELPSRWVIIRKDGGIVVSKSVS